MLTRRLRKKLLNLFYSNLHSFYIFYLFVNDAQRGVEAREGGCAFGTGQHLFPERFCTYVTVSTSSSLQVVVLSSLLVYVTPRSIESPERLIQTYQA